LHERIRRANLTDRFQFLGEVPADEMPAVTRRLSLLVAAGRYEGFGMTPLEAMPSGVAVVAADTGAYAAMIRPGETGQIVPVGDAAAMADAIFDITGDPERLHDLGRNGRRRAVETYSLDGELNKIASVYHRLWSGERF
jgi:mannosyltransferase